MHNGVMKAWLESSHLAGANATYVEELYELYLSDPDSVSDEWRSVFEELPVFFSYHQVAIDCLIMTFSF